MVRVSMVIALGLCILFTITSRAYAQDNPASGNSRMEQIRQLRVEMVGLQQQHDPLVLRMQQLMSQVKALRAQMLPLEEKEKVDSQKMQTLLKEQSEYISQHDQGQGQPSS